MLSCAAVSVPSQFAEPTATMIRASTIPKWRWRRRVDDLLSKAVYGNLAGFSQNRAVRKSPNAADGDLSTKGFSLWSGIDPSRLARVRDRYNEIIVDPAHSDFLTAGAKPAKAGQPVYRYLVRDAFLRNHYRGAYHLHSVAMWRTTNVPAEIAETQPPYSLKWHNDHHTVDTLKLFILLSDVTEDDGPFHFLSLEQTKRVIRRGFRDRHNYGIPLSEIEDRRHLHRLIGPVGTAAFCNTTVCLHKAGVPKSGRTRDILQFRFEAVRPM